LIEHLLTERGIPLGEYEIKQQDSYSNYIPNTTAVSNPLNGQYNQLFDNTLEVDQLFGKESGQAPGNELYLKYSQETQMARFSYGDASTVQTKVLHSSMVDLSNATPDTFEEIAIRQWCQMANNGLYEAYVTFRDPISSEVYSLHALDAFFYMQYLAMRRDGFELFEIPEYLNMRQRRRPKPTVDDLLSVVDYKARDLRYIAEAIVAGQPSVIQCLSVDAFSQLVLKLYEESYRHWFIISSMEDYYERALVENMVHQLYEDERTEFNLGVAHVGEWLHAMNLPAYDYDRTEADLLIKAIFEAGAGIKLDGTKQLRNIQKALIDLMTELSSYSIQFVREINDTDVIIINWPAVRLGNQRLHMEYLVPVDNGVIVENAPCKATREIEIGATGKDAIIETYDIIPKDVVVTHDPIIDVQTAAIYNFEYTDLNSGMLMDVSYTGQDSAIDDEFKVAGISVYQNLPLVLKQKVKSIYPGA
jgi:hypothetical protein